VFGGDTDDDLHLKISVTYLKQTINETGEVFRTYLYSFLHCVPSQDNCLLLFFNLNSPCA